MLKWSGVHTRVYFCIKLSKSRIIKIFEMDRRKLQRRLRFLILFQQISRIKQPNQKKKKRFWVRDIFKIRERQRAFET